MKELYAAVVFLGQPVTFISERQLEEGTGPKVDVILLPHTTHVRSSTVKALEAFSKRNGRIAAVGDHCLAYDEYHRNHPKTAQTLITDHLALTLHGKALSETIRPILTRHGLKIKLVELTDLEKQKPAWGIEFRTVSYNDTILIPMINMLPKPQTIKMPFQGPATDLISGQSVDPAHLTLESMVPCLLQVKNKAK